MCIDAGAQTVGGTARTRQLSGKVSFPQGNGSLGTEVGLGTLHTEDATGRLLVFAADGRGTIIEQSARFYERRVGSFERFVEALSFVSKSLGHAFL